MSALITGIQSVLVAVTDPDPHLRLWQTLGWAVVSTQHRDAALYGRDGQVTVVELSAPGAGSGRVELLQFESGRQSQADRPHPLSPGLFSIDIYVSDIEAAGAACAAAGFGWGGGGPQDYEFASPASGTVIVREGLVEGPDGLNLVLVRAGRPRPTQAWAADPAAFSTELSSVVLSSSDVDASVAFLGPAGLGLDVIYDVVLAQEALARMLALAPGARFRLAFLGGAGTARVELMSPDPPTLMQVSPASALPQAGVMAWAVAVASVEETVERAGSAGAEVLHRAEGRATVAMPGGGVLEVRPA